ncbi:MAG: hypothetical protein R3D29_14210 [Nitratireductor sp.]
MSLIYLAAFVLAFGLYLAWNRTREARHDFYQPQDGHLFGDESTVSANRFASIVSIVTLFALWGAFTGSKIVPIHVPGPFIGDTSFEYTATNAAGQTANATVYTQGASHWRDSLPESHRREWICQG